MLNLKTTLLYLNLVCFSFGCDNMYPKEKPNSTPYARGYIDAVNRLVKEYKIPITQEKLHEGYTLDSLKYVNE